MAKTLLASGDIVGAWAIVPTPATPNASDWRAIDTVNVDEAARMVEGLIAAGVNGILSMGTLGECATLTAAERRTFIATMVEAAAGRVPVFAGTTALNTRDTVAQTREARDLGADGTMLGLPMWCAPSLEVAVQFYRDVAEAVPDLNIAVYANPEAFKFDFPGAFWAEVAKLPQVVTAKYLGVGTLMRDLAAVAGRIKLLPLDFDYYAAARMDDSIDAFWSSGAVCDPVVTVALRDIVADARARNDWSQAKAFAARLGASGAPLFPKGSFKEFSLYNIGLEKERFNAAGWMKAGPPRPPYHIVPDSYLEGARKSAAMWVAIGKSLREQRAAADPAASARAGTIDA